MSFIIENGDFFSEGEKKVEFPTINRHGVFETIRVYKGRIPLLPYHFERLIFSFQQWEIKTPHFFTTEYLAQLILSLCKKNNCLQNARVRLIARVSDKNSPSIDFTIEASGFNGELFEWNEKGISLGIFTSAKKKQHSLKSTNYQFYKDVAAVARVLGFDDCFIFNEAEKYTETSIANIFIIKDEKIITPPLSDGCVRGVMRQFLLDRFQEEKMPVIEKSLAFNDVYYADEIFLTNALRGIRWVGEFQDKTYANKSIAAICQKIL